MTTVNADEVLKAFTNIDNGCGTCMSSFLNAVPLNFAEELAAKYNDLDIYYPKGFKYVGDTWKEIYD